MTRTDDVVTERLRAADPLPLDDLDRLLRETAPPDVSAFPAAPRRRGRRVLWGAATAAAVAGVAGVLVLSLPRGEERAAIPGHIGILDRPATDADRLPDWVYGERALLELNLDRDAARLAVVAATRRYYVVPANGGVQVCLVDIPSVAPPLPQQGSGSILGPGTSTGGIQCAATQVFAQRFLPAVIALRRDGETSVLAGIVPDGFDRASMAGVAVDIRDNVFVLRTPRLDDGVRVTGPSGTRTAYHGYSLTLPAGRIPTGLDPTASVFSRPATPADTPPRVLRAALDAARSRQGGPDPEPATERRVAVAGRTSYWLIRDRFKRRGPRALLAMVARGGVVLRPLALPTRATPVRAFPSTVVWEPYGPSRITLRSMVPDGFTSAVVGGRTFPIRDNFLLVRGLPVTGSYTVELRGPAGRVTVGAQPGRLPSRYIIPTNDVPYRAETFVTARARRAGLTGRLTATIVAGTRGDITRLLGTWAALDGTGRGPSPAPAPYGIRTTAVITVRSDARALVIVLDSAQPSSEVFRQREYRADQVPDMSVLGRVRPLKLD